MPSIDEYMEEIKPLFESKWLTNNGLKHQKFEKMLKERLNVNNVSLFTNGHMALEVAIKSMDFKKGSEVITTPFTFASTIHAIVNCGLKPVFCDIKKDDYTIDADKIENLITDKTVAILPVHVYGHICDVESIGKIAKKYNLKVIYDAAHAFNEEYHHENVANFGDISMFSFHATKVFNTIEGGALTYSSNNLKPIIEKMKNFGIDGPDRVIMVGTNAKMNEFSASMGICNLRHLDEEILKRKKVYERYLERLSGQKGITVSQIDSSTKANYAYFPVLFDKNIFGMSRDDVMKKLEKENIFTRKYFYPLITDFDCYKDSFDSNLTPIAKKISEEVLTLPMYADLSLSMVDKICDIILGA